MLFCLLMCNIKLSSDYRWKITYIDYCMLPLIDTWIKRRKVSSMALIISVKTVIALHCIVHVLTFRCLQINNKIYFLLFFVPCEVSLTFLQSVNILGVHSEQQAFVVEHADEVVYVVGSVAARIQSFGQGEERLRVVGEVVDVENSFWIRDVVLLQVGVKTCSWSSAKVQTFWHVHVLSLQISQGLMSLLKDST